MSLINDIIFSIIVAILYTLISLYCDKHILRKLDEVACSNLFVIKFFIYFFMLFFFICAFKYLPDCKTNIHIYLMSFFTLIIIDHLFRHRG